LIKIAGQETLLEVKSAIEITKNGVDELNSRPAGFHFFYEVMPPNSAPYWDVHVLGEVKTGQRIYYRTYGLQAHLEIWDELPDPQDPDPEPPEIEAIPSNGYTATTDGFLMAVFESVSPGVLRGWVNN